MNSNQNSPNVSGVLNVKDLPHNPFQPTYPQLVAGKWYWIQYGAVRYNPYTERETHHSFKEIQKCIDVWETQDGEHGVFKTDKIGIQNISSAKCFPYNGPMKKEFIFWGEEVPDI